jgi:hypothetical protein
MGFSAQGCKFIWTDGTAACTTAMDSTGAVAEVSNISGPSGSAGVIDVTVLADVAKSKMMGLPDEGQISLELNFAYSTSGSDKQKAIVADRKSRTRRAWGIIFSDTSSSLARGKGYVTGFSVTGSVDNKLTAAVTIEIDGAVTWST